MVGQQQTLIDLTDNPGQFREPPLSGIFRQAWRWLHASTAHIDALLDERSSTTRRGAYQSCVDCGGTAP